MTRVHSRSVRAAVFALSARRCVYCGECLDRIERAQDFAVDHVVPISRGGSNAITNLVASCKTCNSAKGDKSLLHFLIGETITLPPEKGMRPLREHREFRSMSADTLAEKAGISNKTISDIELGKVRPKFRTINRICAALGVDPIDVVEFMRMDQ